jgi:hypothetical protein
MSLNVRRRIAGAGRGAVLALVAVSLALAAVGGAGAIANGRPDGNLHPYVGLIVFDGANGPSHRCSGALLSPTVVLTAGHCTEGTVAARVWFAEVVQGNPEYPFSGATSYDGVPHTYPDFCIECRPGLPGFAYRDIGVVVLTEPVPTSVVGRYARLPTAGLVDTLANKTAVTVVGYGVQERLRGGGPPVWAGLRVRLYAQSELVSGRFTHSSEFVRLSLNASQGSGGICFGDSGGPDLLGTSDIVLAVNSYGTNANCAGVGYSSRVDIPAVLAWINSFLD